MPSVVTFLAWLVVNILCCTAIGGEDRLARTVAALDALEATCEHLEGGNESALPFSVPLVVGREALRQFREANEADPELLDHIYLSALKARVALLEATKEGRWRPVPPAPTLSRLSFRAGRCVANGQVVFPVACEEAPTGARRYFASGVLRTFVPALSGVQPGTLEKSEVWRIYQSDPTAHRVGWDGPAGGFVCDGRGRQPPVLICLEHPGIREAIAKETTRAVYALDPSSRPLYLSLGDDCFYVDYSDLSSRGFIEWLKKRYGTLRVVNTAWGTDFEEFSPEMMPRPEEAGISAARWFDWVDFNRRRLTSHIEWACGNVRRVLPQLPLGLSCFRYALAGSRGLSGVDPSELAARLDVLEANGADPMTLDLAIGVAEGKKPVVDASLETSDLGVIGHFIRGCAAVGLRRWPPVPLTSVAGVRATERVLRESLAARRLAAELRLLSEARRPLALLYSDASMLQVPPQAVRCDQTPHTRLLRQVYDAARFAGVLPRFLTSRAVAARRWKGVKTLVVAGSPAEEDRVVRGLLDFVELGGELVLIAEALTTDEHGREADYLARLGLEVLQTHRPALRADPRPERGGALDELIEERLPGLRLSVARGGFLGPQGTKLPATGLTQRIHVNVAHEVLATYPDGSPAVVRFRRGNGAVTYFAVCPEPRALSAALLRLLEPAGARTVEVFDPDFDTWGVEWTAARDGAKVVVWLWNTTTETKRLSLRVAGSPSKAVEALSGEAIETAAGVVGPIYLASGEDALVIIQGGSEE